MKYFLIPQNICITKRPIDYKVEQKGQQVYRTTTLFHLNMLFAWISHNDHLWFGSDSKATGQSGE